MRELAAASVLAGLTPEEQADLDRHLAGGCAVCAEEIRIVGELAVGVGIAAPADPPPSLREKLLGRLGRAPRFPGILMEDHGLLIARSIELDWQPFSPGIDFKVLHTDTDRCYNTMLVRFAPGARYSPHRHTQVEHLFLLSGDLHVASVIMRPGDYCRAEPETLHGETFSETGCTALVMASPDDELMA
jgi:quercetin dioxygenase-like cupin family protein